MVDRSVPALGETDGAIVVERAGQRLDGHQVGDWPPATVALAVSIPNDPDAASLKLGPRPDGRGYSDRDVGAVVEVVGLASRAIGLIERVPERTAAGAPDSR